MTPASQALRLKARVASLAVKGRWLQPTDFAHGYDRAASSYETTWQQHLRPITSEFLQGLPTGASSVVLDLGCGTGFCARHLAEHNPRATVVGVDISAGMLEQAKMVPLPNLKYECSDMLAFLRAMGSSSAGLIVSTWSMGYSYPAKVIQECARVLQPDGTLAFIINYSDTLDRVFQAYQRCMFQFPQHVQKAAWPRFPKRWSQLSRFVGRAGLELRWHEDGHAPIPAPQAAWLPWLRQTGMLAGFETMLDLSGDAAAYLEEQLRAGRERLHHHYAAVIAVRP